MNLSIQSVLREPASEAAGAGVRKLASSPLETDEAVVALRAEAWLERAHPLAPILPRPQAFRLRATPPAALGVESEVVRLLSVLFAREALTIAQARRISRLRYEQCRAFIDRCAQIGLVQVVPAPLAGGPPAQWQGPEVRSSAKQRTFILPAKEQSAALQQRALAQSGG